MMNAPRSKIRLMDFPLRSGDERVDSLLSSVRKLPMPLTDRIMPTPAIIKITPDERMYVLVYCMRFLGELDGEKYMGSAELFGPIDTGKDLRSQITPRHSWKGTQGDEDICRDYDAYNALEGTKYKIGDVEELLANQERAMEAIRKGDRVGLEFICTPCWDVAMARHIESNM